jgi:hypothetical protein
MFVFRHGKYTFLQLKLIGMRNFAIPGRASIALINKC